MAQCKDCLYHEMCYHTHSSASPSCEDFKDKERFLELPCKVGDSVQLSGLPTPWKVSAIHFYAEGEPQISVTSKTNRITSTLTLSAFETVACVIPNEKGATDERN